MQFCVQRLDNERRLISLRDSDETIITVIEDDEVGQLDASRYRLLNRYFAAYRTVYLKHVIKINESIVQGVALLPSLLLYVVRREV